jgi:uncharacterized protein (DUF4415 family)
MRPSEAGSAQEDDEMKKEYDFSRGRRGAVLGAPLGKTRITIRIDDDVLQWFRAQVHKAGGGSYQTAMSEALRRAMESPEGHVEEHSGPPLNQREETGRTLTALMFKNVTAFLRAAEFALDTGIRAEAPGHLTLIIPIGDKHLFEKRGFKFREI